MTIILARCPAHRAYQQGCPRCQTADDICNMSLHEHGQCNTRCKSMTHFESPHPDHGVAGRGGLVYYADGTTSADRPLAAADAR